MIESKNTTAGTQTEYEILDVKQKGGIYEKIDNIRRCELIRLLQKEHLTLKLAAENLGINYSTAKTIVQTFRKERRITKKPKRAKETKKGKRREKYMKKILTKLKVDQLLNCILEKDRLSYVQVKKIDKLMEPEISDSISKIGNLPTLCAFETIQQVVDPFPDASNSIKPLPRVFSAAQMILFDPAEEGPLVGQVSRAVDATQPVPYLVRKKEYFNLYSEKNPEEEYRVKVDYSDPIILRLPIKSFESNEAEPQKKQLNKLPCLWEALPEKKILNCCQPVTGDYFIATFSFIPFYVTTSQEISGKLSKEAVLDFNARTLPIPHLHPLQAPIQQASLIP